MHSTPEVHICIPSSQKSMIELVNINRSPVLSPLGLYLYIKYRGQMNQIHPQSQKPFKTRNSGKRHFLTSWQKFASISPSWLKIWQNAQMGLQSAMLSSNPFGRLLRYASTCTETEAQHGSPERFAAKNLGLIFLEILIFLKIRASKCKPVSMGARWHQYLKTHLTISHLEMLTCDKI